MPKDSREDISSLTEKSAEYMMISLLSHKIEVLIVGGGTAGYIKAKAFSEKGAKVTVVSKAFIKELKELERNLSGIANSGGSLTLIEDEYKKEYIQGKHIVIIATDSRAVNNEIKEHCNQMAKIYLSCEDYREGLFITPMQMRTRNVNIGLNTRGASPKTARFLADRLKKDIEEYDEFVEYACEIRDAYKGSHLKDKILNIVNSEEFYHAFKKGKHEELLNSINVL